MLLSQISGRIVSDIQEAQGMRFDEILRASLTMPTIMGIAQYISDCKNPSKNQMHSNAGNQTRNSYTVVYIFGDNENEIRDVLIEKLSASNISCKRVGGQEIIERCHEDINVKKKYIIAFSEMASLCITKASELLGENIIITGMYMAPNIQLFELDIDKESNIGKFFKGSDLVIGAIGPSADYSEKMLLGAMAENIPYVDPGGIHLIRKMRNSSMKGTAIVGSGIFPGLSGWMLSSVLKEAFNDDLIEMIIGGVYNFSKAAAIDYVEEIKSYKAGIPMACVRNGKILPAQKRSPLNLPTRISKLSILPYVTEEIQEIIQGKYMLNIDSYTAAPVSLFSIVNKAHCQKKDLVNALMGQKNSNQKAFIWVRQNKGNDSRCIYFEGKNPSVLTGEILAITANAIFEMPRKDGIYTMASYLEKYQVLDELKKIDKFKSEGKI